MPKTFKSRPVFSSFHAARKAARAAQGPVSGYLYHFGDMLPIVAGTRWCETH